MVNKQVKKRSRQRTHLERLLDAGYGNYVKSHLKYFTNADLKDLIPKFQRDTVIYKQLFTNLESSLPTIYAERFWLENNFTLKEKQDAHAFLFEKLFTSEQSCPYEWEGSKSFKNYLKLDVPTRTAIFEAFQEKYFSILASRKFQKENNYTIDKKSLKEQISHARDFKIEFTGKLMNEGELPLDYILKLFSDIDSIEKPYREYFESNPTDFKQDEHFMEYYKKYYNLWNAESPIVKFYGHINHVLTNIGRDLEENDVIGAQTNIALLTALSLSEKRVLSNIPKDFKPLRAIGTHELKSEDEMNSANMVRLDEFYRTGKISDYISEYFEESELGVLEKLRIDPNIMKNVDIILQEGELYKKNVQDAVDKIEFARSSMTLEKNRRYVKKYNKIKITASYELYKLVENYEKKDQITITGYFNWILPDLFCFPDADAAPIDYSKVKTIDDMFRDSVSWNHSFDTLKKELGVDFDIHLKVINYVKKQVADKTPNKDLTYKLQELEKIFAGKVNKLRDHSKSFISEHSKTVDIIFETLSGYIQDSHTPLSEIKSFDCLSSNGAYELQGLSLLNNSKSTILQLKKPVERLSPKYHDNTHYVVGRVFLYDAEINTQKGLFVAGFSGSEGLDDLNLWEENTIKALLSFAEKNDYSYLFFNINPLGDIRNPDTRYSHEFVKAVASGCGIPERAYTYMKYGSGRKPKFFELDIGAKKIFTKKIVFSRDEDLIGTFFVEGMFGTREEAINSKIFPNPEKESFTPYFFEKEGYAPVIRYDLR